MIDFVSVGMKIMNCRKNQHMTQDELANKLFVTRQLVSKWELGTGIPSIDVLISLSKLFKISVDELLCLDEEIEIDEENIFAGHNREFIVNSILNNKLTVNIPDVLYQFSTTERLVILKAIKDNKIKCDIDELSPRLTPGEKKFLELESNYEIVKKE